MSHICVFIAFQEVDIIKRSFESLYMEGVDYFIVENRSENSKEIEEYFKTKKLKGYIQFEKNIANKAIQTFIQDFMPLLKWYDYITITDGDLYSYDIDIAFKEIKENLEKPNAVLASSGLWLGNMYNRPVSDRLIGTHHYDSYMSNQDVELGGTEMHTGGYLMTVKKENLKYLVVDNFLDSNIKGQIYADKKLWIRSKYSDLYHLTWDLYIDGNPYYEWKKSVYPAIWTQPKTSKYKILI